MDAPDKMEEPSGSPNLALEPEESKVHLPEAQGTMANEKPAIYTPSGASESSEEACEENEESDPVHQEEIHVQVAAGDMDEKRHDAEASEGEDHLLENGDEKQEAKLSPLSKLDSKGRKLSARAKTAFKELSCKAERLLQELKYDLKPTEAPKAAPVLPSQKSFRESDLPWVAKNAHEKRYEEEFREKILQISHKPEEYLLKHVDEAILVDMRAAMQSAGAVLEVDDELRKLRFEVVPKKVKEQEFWRRYFIAVKRIKQEILAKDTEENSAARHRRASSLARDLGGRYSALAPPEEVATSGPETELSDAPVFVPVAVPPAMFVRRLMRAVGVARTVKSCEELSVLEEEEVESPKASEASVDTWTAFREKMGASLQALGQNLSNKNKELKKKGSKSSGREYHALLWSLFEADAQWHKGDGGSELGTPTAAPRGPCMAEEIHGAPPGSFVALLAETMASLKSEQKMASFWLEVVKQLRKHWSEGRPIPGTPEDKPPELHFCMLHQQIQLLNCCIARRKRRRLALDSAANSVTSTLPTLVTPAEMASGGENEGGANGRGEKESVREGALGPIPLVKLLETGETMYAPVTQEGPILTEELMREQEELVLRTGSVGYGCKQLLSDMQAFQAANPGCVLADFVRWYSPLDWVEDPTTATPPLPINPPENSTTPEESESKPEHTGRSGTESKINGVLSARMQSEGNLWQELWTSAKPVPAYKQAPLFDEELAGESTLDALTNILPSDLFEQLFLVALGSGFSIAEQSPQAGLEPLTSCLKECTKFAVATCGRGMSQAKLERLFQIYEKMEQATLLPPEPLEPHKDKIANVESSETAQYVEVPKPESGEEKHEGESSGCEEPVKVEADDCKLLSPKQDGEWTVL